MPLCEMVSRGDFGDEYLDLKSLCWLSSWVATFSSFVSAYHLLSKPLLRDDGRIYVCSQDNFFAFESNGTIAWTMHLDYKCNLGTAPVHGGDGKVIYI